MPTVRTLLAAVLLALAGTSAPARAEPMRLQCQADEAIPEFVTRRVELVAAAKNAGAPPGTAAVELEQDPICRGLRAEP